VVRHFSADKVRDPDIAAIAAAAPQAEYVLAAIQHLVIGSDPDLVRRELEPSVDPSGTAPIISFAEEWRTRRDSSEAGRIYLFDGDAAMQAFLGGPIIAEMEDGPT
jgi:hypothetical protein